MIDFFSAIGDDGVMICNDSFLQNLDHFGEQFIEIFTQNSS